MLGRCARTGVLLDIVLGGGRGLEFRVNGCDLECASLATFSAATAAAAASALLAARAFALVACRGVDAATSGAVVGLSSAAASSSRGGFGFDGLLLEVHAEKAIAKRARTIPMSWRLAFR